MGEIIKNIGKAIFQDNPCEFLEIELNLGGIVHMQTNSWRIELKENEFMEFAKSVVQASEILKKNKNI
jgi:hypothetical protein